MAARSSYYRVCVGVVTLLALHVQKGHALRCYSCSSKQHEACAEPDTSQYAPVRCDATMVLQMKNHAKDISPYYENIFDVDVPHIQVGLICLKVIVKEGNKEYIMRGCQLDLHNNLDICKKVEEKNGGMIRMAHCSKCRTDSCNSSTQSKLSVALTLICLVICQAVTRL